jgi:hypothetical protein
MANNGKINGGADEHSVVGNSMQVVNDLLTNGCELPKDPCYIILSKKLAADIANILFEKELETPVHRDDLRSFFVRSLASFADISYRNRNDNRGYAQTVFNKLLYTGLSVKLSKQDAEFLVNVSYAHLNQKWKPSTSELTKLKDLAKKYF